MVLLSLGPLYALIVNKETLLPQSLSDRHLSAKLVPTFADRRCHIVSATDPHGHIFCFLDREIIKYNNCIIKS
jgi:hypothetical protein